MDAEDLDPIRAAVQDLQVATQNALAAVYQAQAAAQTQTDADDTSAGEDVIDGEHEQI
jgi:hypothetical protein